MSIKVSVVVPVYGVSDYIKRCLEAVVHQTYSNIECILVDDVSPDDSIEKCEQLIADYQGPISFSILHHESNRGLSAARNTGLKAATGEYVFFFDSDDLITPDCIEKLIKPVLNDPGIEMVIGSFERRSDGSPIKHSERLGVKLKERDIPTHKQVRDSYFNNQLHVNAWNKLVRRAFLERYKLFFEEGYLWEDLVWTYFVMKHLSHLYTISDVTYYQLKRPQSITTGTARNEKLHHWGKVYKLIASNFTPGEEAREATYYLLKFCHYGFRTPEKEVFVKTADLFKQALSDGKHPFSLWLLSLAVFFAKRKVMGA